MAKVSKVPYDAAQQRSWLQKAIGNHSIHCHQQHVPSPAYSPADDDPSADTLNLCQKLLAQANRAGELLSFSRTAQAFEPMQ
jgi:hypothetical protein